MAAVHHARGLISHQHGNKRKTQGFVIVKEWRSNSVYIDNVQVLGYSGSILALLFCLIWFKSEVVTIHRRSTLPPGDLGYPIVGETLSFFLNPSSYGKLKQEKFGDMYTENTISLGVVLGHHVDIAWLWNSERKGRAQGMWPPHIRALLGKGAVANTSGQQHRMLRRMLEPAFTPNATRDYVNVLDQATQDSLKKWASVDSFHSSSEFKMFALRLFFIAGFGSVDEEMIHRLHDDFTIWLNGFGSLVPLRIPGTLFPCLTRPCALVNESSKR